MIDPFVITPQRFPGKLCARTRNYQGRIDEMKNFVNRVIIFVLLSCSMSVAALAKPIKKQITFNEPVKVNGVLLKQGTYDVAFNEETSELTISKGKRVLAKAPAQLESLSKDSNVTYETASEDPNSNVGPKLLTRVSMKDRVQAKVLNGADAKAEGVRRD
jgi:hypothetical protein